MKEIKSTEWDHQFISKKEIYNTLQEISSSYGACCSVDKQSAVFRCIDALMTTKAITIGRCEECKHFNSNSEICNHFTSSPYEDMEDAEIYVDKNDFCSYFEPKGDDNK